MVESFSAITFPQDPSTSSPTSSSFRPLSAETTVASVKIAISSIISLRRSPNDGAFSTSELNTPFSLFSTKSDNASPSTSSAIITNSFFPAWAHFSSNGKISDAAPIFLSQTKTSGFSNTASWRFTSVMKNAEAYPLSYENPSTISCSIVSPCPASTVTTPSLPIFAITSAISCPISLSPAEIVATSAIFFESPAIFSADFSIPATISAPAFSMPRRSSIGFTPAAISLLASAKIL